jgi:hypothetical protein
VNSRYEGLRTAPKLSRRMVTVGGQAFPEVGNVVINLPVTGTRHFQHATLQHVVGVGVAMFAVWKVGVGHCESHDWSLP